MSEMMEMGGRRRFFLWYVLWREVDLESKREMEMRVWG